MSECLVEALTLTDLDSTCIYLILNSFDWDVITKSRFTIIQDSSKADSLIVS